jgi:hypothetical protein
MHADVAGVVRGELEQRVAFAADGKKDAFAFQGVDGAGDFLALELRIGEALVNLSDAEETVAAEAKEIDDRLLQVGA